MGKDHPDANLHPEATGLAAKTVQVSSKLALSSTAD
jgi:glutathione S-transferase